MSHRIFNIHQYSHQFPKCLFRRFWRISVHFTNNLTIASRSISFSLFPSSATHFFTISSRYKSGCICSSVPIRTRNKDPDMLCLYFNIWGMRKYIFSDTTRSFPLQEYKFRGLVLGRTESDFCK